MDKIVINGRTPLKGVISVGGAKNAALPLMAACLLTDEPLTLSNVPFLSDITTMGNLLTHHGVSLTIQDSTMSTGGRTITICAENINNTTAPYEIVRKMRASVIVLGPLISRFGEAEISLPGGCAIGSRPINMHLSALEKMGADIILNEGYIRAMAKNGLHGAEINFPIVSVGATENIILAASLAKGVTRINNAAREPEIVDLCACLNTMGADISGGGTNKITIKGSDVLHGTSHKVMPDRIEAGTYAVAAAITGGDITLRGITHDIISATLELLKKTGAIISIDGDSVRVTSNGKIRNFDIATSPYPGFATDMQAQFTALAALSDGNSTITETIFENRFMHVAELRRMGAEISLNGNSIIVTGKPLLNGAEVMATDLRASVSLVLAALAAKGKTTINRVYHIDRGYERLEEKLRACGADIKRKKADQD